MNSKEIKPILIQGAMDIEIEWLLKEAINLEKITINNKDFYKGYINEIPVVISKTDIGTLNTAIATMAAIMEFKPLIIINQGIAGAHISDLHINDIVIGEKVANINTFDTEVKAFGEGSNSFDWSGHDWFPLSIDGNEDLIEVAKKIEYKNGKVYCGVIGSGDIWNKEVDRINWIHEKYETLCEDMESIATYTVCDNFNIPCIGIRIISNNEIIGGGV